MARECPLCVRGTGFCDCRETCASPRCTGSRMAPRAPDPDFEAAAGNLRRLLFGPSPEELPEQLAAMAERVRAIDGPARPLAAALVEVMGVSRKLAVRAVADPGATITYAEMHTMLLDAVERGMRS